MRGTLDSVIGSWEQAYFWLFLIRKLWLKEVVRPSSSIIICIHSTYSHCDLTRSEKLQYSCLSVLMSITTPTPPAQRSQ